MNAATANSEKLQYRARSVDVPNLQTSMLPRLRQELRVIAPYAIGIFACEVIITAWQILVPLAKSKVSIALVMMMGSFGIACFPILICALCLQPFLIEFQDGTLSQLLVQPISRRRIWYEKLSISSALLLALFGCFCGAELLLTRTYVAKLEYAPSAVQLYGIATNAVGFTACAVSISPTIVTIVRRPLPCLLILIAWDLILGTILISLVNLLGLDLSSQELALAQLFFLIVGSLSYILSHHCVMWLEL